MVVHQMVYGKVLPIITVEKINSGISPVLRKVVSKVVDPTAVDIKQIVANMIATAEKNQNTVGLAAPQINISLAIFVYRNSSSRCFIPIINPEIEVIENDLLFGREGCLSIPGYMGIVPRNKAIRYKYQDLQGKTIIKGAAGYHARIIQHEFDHLNGILYTDLINTRDPEQFGLIDTIKVKVPNQTNGSTILCNQYEKCAKKGTINLEN